MSQVKLTDLEGAPKEGEIKVVEFDHPWTEINYRLALFFAKGRYLALRDECYNCGSSFETGELKAMYVFCAREQHAWNIKTGLYKFDRRLSIPTYRVAIQDDGLYIEI